MASDFVAAFPASRELNAEMVRSYSKIIDLSSQSLAGNLETFKLKGGSGTPGGEGGVAGGDTGM